MNGGGFRCGYHFLFCRFWTNIQQVVADGSVKEIGLLGDNTSQCPKRGQCYPVDIVPINLYRTAVNVIETWDQARDRRFSGSTWSHNGHQLTWLHSERDALQGQTRCWWLKSHVAFFLRDLLMFRRCTFISWYLRLISKGDVPKRDGTAHLRGRKIHGIGSILDLNLLVEIFKNAIKQGQGSLDLNQ